MQKIEITSTGKNNQPLADVIITDCGELDLDTK